MLKINVLYAMHEKRAIDAKVLFDDMSDKYEFPWQRFENFFDLFFALLDTSSKRLLHQVLQPLCLNMTETDSDRVRLEFYAERDIPAAHYRLFEIFKENLDTLDEKNLGIKEGSAQHQIYMEDRKPVEQSVQKHFAK